MSNKEKYGKPIANIITFDISDPIVTASQGSGLCQAETYWKQRSDCEKNYYPGCITYGPFSQYLD